LRIKLNTPSKAINLKLDPSEVDGAVWLSKDNLHDFINMVENDVQGFIPGEQKETIFKMSQFFSPYPNAYKEGISKAHNMAIRYLLKS
jgi:hypothetical protein